MSSVTLDILSGFLVFLVLPICILTPPILAYRGWRAISLLTLGEWVLIVVLAFLGFGIFANIVVVLQAVGVY